MQYFTRFMLALTLLAGVGSPLARADLGLLLNAKPNDKLEFNTAALTGEGHAAVYLSRVCAASPVKLRRCEPGEMGSVIQNYVNYQEDERYEWNAVPLSIYLYGVENPADRPLFATPELRTLLQGEYRKKYLRQLCAGPPCTTSASANWRDSVAASFVREIYMFQVHTTAEQDDEFILKFNARQNINHYNGFSRHCADFAKLVVDTYFPHSAHRDLLNDFGMTGPKAIARSFSHYAERRPQLNFHVIRVEQLPGTYPRSSACHEGTEQTFRSKKWLVPLAALEFQALPPLAASYWLTGRFSPDHEVKHWPDEDTADLRSRLASAKFAGNKAQVKQIKDELKSAQGRELGTAEEWARSRSLFEEILQSAIADGVVADKHELRNMFRELEGEGRPYFDDDGQLWLEVKRGGVVHNVGLTAGTVLAGGSDRELALEVLLARTNDLVYENAKHRETRTEFAADWQLLERALPGLTSPSAPLTTLLPTATSAP